MFCLFVFYISGNGVVIHLPGLFEEAEKNLQKGKGEPFRQSHISILSTLQTLDVTVWKAQIHP